jgi:hypothetical protein
MTKIEPGAVYTKDPDVVFRKIADEFVLVPIRQKAVDLRSIYTLNETAAFAWGALDGKNTVKDVTESMASEFDVEASSAASDVSDMLSQLEALSFIKKA